MHIEEGEEEISAERQESQKQELKKIDDYGNSEPEYYEEEQVTNEEEEAIPID